MAPTKLLEYILNVSPSVFMVAEVRLKSMVETPVVCAAMVRKSVCRSISLKIMP